MNTDIPPLVEAIFGEAARRDFTSYEHAITQWTATDMIGYCGLTVRTIKLGVIPMEIAGIGFVCVHPLFRRQGIFKGMMSAAHDRAKLMRLPFALLNTGTPDLYTALGYFAPGNLPIGWMVAELDANDSWDKEWLVDLQGSW